MKLNLSASFSHMTCMLWFFWTIKCKWLVSSAQFFQAREGNLSSFSSPGRGNSYVNLTISWQHRHLCLALREKRRRRKNYFLTVRRPCKDLFSSSLTSVFFFYSTNTCWVPAKNLAPCHVMAGTPKYIPYLPAQLRFLVLLEIQGAILGFRVISLSIWHVQLLRFGCGIGRELD